METLKSIRARVEAGAGLPRWSAAKALAAVTQDGDALRYVALWIDYPA